MDKKKSSTMEIENLELRKKVHQAIADQVMFISSKMQYDKSKSLVGTYLNILKLSSEASFEYAGSLSNMISDGNRDTNVITEWRNVMEHISNCLQSLLKSVR
jgi:hypothetical protein